MPLWHVFGSETEGRGAGCHDAWVSARLISKIGLLPCRTTPHPLGLRYQKIQGESLPKFIESRHVVGSEWLSRYGRSHESSLLGNSMIESLGIRLAHCAAGQGDAFHCDCASRQQPRPAVTRQRYHSQCDKLYAIHRRQQPRLVLWACCLPRGRSETPYPCVAELKATHVYTTYTAHATALRSQTALSRHTPAGRMNDVTMTETALPPVVASGAPAGGPGPGDTTAAQQQQQQARPPAAAPLGEHLLFKVGQTEGGDELVAQTVSGLISNNQTLAERGLINKQLYVIGASTDELLLSDAQDVALASLIASGMTDGWKVEVLQSRVSPQRGSTIWLLTAPSHEEALKLLDPQTAPWLTAGVTRPGAVAGSSSSTRSIGRLTVLPYPGEIQHSGDPGSQWVRAKCTALAGKSTAGGVHALYNFGGGLYSATQHEAALAQEAGDHERAQAAKTQAAEHSRAAHMLEELWRGLEFDVLQVRKGGVWTELADGSLLSMYDAAWDSIELMLNDPDAAQLLCFASCGAGTSPGQYIIDGVHWSFTFTSDAPPSGGAFPVAFDTVYYLAEARGASARNDAGLRSASPSHTLRAQRETWRRMTAGERYNLALTYMSFRATALRKRGLHRSINLPQRPLPPLIGTSLEAQVIQMPGNRTRAQLMFRTEAEAVDVLAFNRGFKNSRNVALPLAPAKDQGTLGAKAATLKRQRADAHRRAQQSNTMDMDDSPQQAQNRAAGNKRQQARQPASQAQRRKILKP